jgi:hypothetical protein
MHAHSTVAANHDSGKTLLTERDPALGLGDGRRSAAKVTQTVIPARFSQRETSVPLTRWCQAWQRGPPRADRCCSRCSSVDRACACDGWPYVSRGRSRSFESCRRGVLCGLSYVPQRSQAFSSSPQARLAPTRSFRSPASTPTSRRSASHPAARPSVQTCPRSRRADKVDPATHQPRRLASRVDRIACPPIR